MSPEQLAQFQQTVAMAAQSKPRPARSVAYAEWCADNKQFTTKLAADAKAAGGDSRGAASRYFANSVWGSDDYKPTRARLEAAYNQQKADYDLLVGAPPKEAGEKKRKRDPAEVNTPNKLQALDEFEGMTLVKEGGKVYLQFESGKLLRVTGLPIKSLDALRAQLAAPPKPKRVVNLGGYQLYGQAQKAARVANLPFATGTAPWGSLSADQQKPWNDQSAANKAAAKAAGAATPSAATPADADSDSDSDSAGEEETFEEEEDLVPASAGEEEELAEQEY